MSETFSLSHLTQKVTDGLKEGLEIAKQAAQTLQKAQALESKAKAFGSLFLGPEDCPSGVGTADKLRSEAKVLREKVATNFGDRVRRALNPQDSARPSDSKITDSENPTLVSDSNSSFWAKGLEIFQGAVEPVLNFPQNLFSWGKESSDSGAAGTASSSDSSNVSSLPELKASESAAPKSGTSTATKVAVAGAAVLGLGLLLFGGTGAAAAAGGAGLATLGGGVGASLVPWAAGGAGLMATGGGGTALASWFATSGALALGMVAGGVGVGLVLAASVAGSNLPAVLDPSSTPADSTPDGGCSEEVHRTLLQLGFPTGILTEKLVVELCALPESEWQAKLTELQGRMYFLLGNIARVVGVGPDQAQKIFRELLQEKIDLTQRERRELDFAGVFEFILEATRQCEEADAALSAAQGTDIARQKLLAPHYAAYFLAWHQKVNPENKKLSVLYASMGADVSSVLLATNADSVLGVDILPVNPDELRRYLGHWDVIDAHTPSLPMKMHPQSEQNMRELFSRRQVAPETQLEARAKRGYWGSDTLASLSIERCIMIELKRMGVRKDSITIASNQGNTEIKFEWTHPRSGKNRQRMIRFTKEDMGMFLALRRKNPPEKFDVYYQKSTPMAEVSDFWNIVLPQALPSSLKSESSILINLGSTQPGSTLNPQRTHQSLSQTFASHRYQTQAVSILHDHQVYEGLYRDLPSTRGGDLRYVDYAHRLYGWRTRP